MDGHFAQQNTFLKGWVHKNKAQFEKTNYFKYIMIMVWYYHNLLS